MTVVLFFAKGLFKQVPSSQGAKQAGAKLLSVTPKNFFIEQLSCRSVFGAWLGEVKARASFHVPLAAHSCVLFCSRIVFVFRALQPKWPIHLQDWTPPLAAELVFSGTENFFAKQLSC